MVKNPSYLGKGGNPMRRGLKANDDPAIFYCKIAEDLSFFFYCRFPFIKILVFTQNVNISVNFQKLQICLNYYAYVFIFLYLTRLKLSVSQSACCIQLCGFQKSKRNSEFGANLRSKSTIEKFS